MITADPILTLPISQPPPAAVAPALAGFPPAASASGFQSQLTSLIDAIPLGPCAVGGSGDADGDAPTSSSVFPPIALRALSEPAQVVGEGNVSMLTPAGAAVRPPLQPIPDRSLVSTLRASVAGRGSRDSASSACSNDNSQIPEAEDVLAFEKGGVSRQVRVDSLPLSSTETLVPFHSQPGEPPFGPPAATLAGQPQLRPDEVKKASTTLNRQVRSGPVVGTLTTLLRPSVSSRFADTSTEQSTSTTPSAVAPNASSSVLPALCPTPTSPTGVSEGSHVSPSSGADVFQSGPDGASTSFGSSLPVGNSLQPPVATSISAGVAALQPQQQQVDAAPPAPTAQGPLPTPVMDLTRTPLPVDEDAFAFGSGVAAASAQAGTDPRVVLMSPEFARVEGRGSELAESPLPFGGRERIVGKITLARQLVHSLGSSGANAAARQELPVADAVGLPPQPTGVLPNRTTSPEVSADQWGQSVDSMGVGSQYKDLSKNWLGGYSTPGPVSAEQEVQSAEGGKESEVGSDGTPVAKRVLDMLPRSPQSIEKTQADSARVDRATAGASSQDPMASHRSMSVESLVPEGARSVVNRSTGRREIELGDGVALGGSAAFSVSPGAEPEKAVPPSQLPETGQTTANAMKTEETLNRIDRWFSREVSLGRGVGTGETISMILRPDAHTQLKLELRHEGAAYQAEVRVERGDAALLGADWAQLQSRLEDRGIRLSPLVGAGLSSSGQGDFSSTGERRQSFQESRTLQPDWLPTGASAATRRSSADPSSAVSRQSVRFQSGARGWETWA